MKIIETKFDRFDICEAYYVFACDYHMGQNSWEYQIFGRLSNIGFKPARNLNLKSLTKNGRGIYANLRRKMS